MATARFFTPFIKAEEQDDGTLKVSGIASSESVDEVGEIIKAEAMKEALPDFFKHGTGALREMHQLSAAGTVDSAEMDGGQTLIEATVVDKAAAEKVRKGVYKGFSIGGRVMARDAKNRKIITKLALVEVSLVDRPCNPDAVLTMWKADNGEDMAEANPEQNTNEPVAGDETVERAAAAAALAASSSDVAAEEAESSPEDAAAKAVAAVNRLSDAVAAAVAASDLKKGMYDVASFAGVLANIAYLMKSAQSEAEYEGDKSPVPAQLRGWLGEGVAIFKAMSAEEADELLQTTKKAASAAGLVEAAPEAAEASPTATGADALAKANAAADDLRKALAAKDEMIASITAKIEPLVITVGELQKRFETEPIPAKTARTHAVSKPEDAAGGAAAAAVPAVDPEAVAKVLAEMPEEDRTLLLIKAAHAFPLRHSHHSRTSPTG